MVVNIEVATESVIKRLTGRRTCPKCGEIYNVFLNPPRQDTVCDKDGCKLIQRADDNEEAIRTRLKAYEEDTLPLIDYYKRKNTLHRVDGSGEPGAITESILDLVKAHDYL